MAKKYTLVEEEEKNWGEKAGEAIGNGFVGCIGGSIGCLVLLFGFCVVLGYLRSCMGCSGG